MLAFVDESGDAGFNFGRGSSRFFTIAVVLFEFEADALECQRRVELAASRAGMRPGGEFHFRSDSHQRRLALLQEVRDCRFQISAFSLDKQRCPPGSGYRYPPSLVKNVSKMAFENLNLPSRELRVVYDAAGDRAFRRSLKKYLTTDGRIGEGVAIRQVKGSRSHADPLVQLADYAAGIANRLAEKKRGAESYRDLIGRHRFIHRVWGPPGRAAAQTKKTARCLSGNPRNARPPGDSSATRANSNEIFGDFFPQVQPRPSAPHPIARSTRS